MTIDNIGNVSSSQPLRLWPGVILAVVGLLVFFGAPLIDPAWSVYALLGIVGSGALILVWWLLFSRAPWSERLGAIVLMIVGMAVTSLLVDESIAGAGQRRLLYVMAVPTLGFALVGWAIATRNLTAGRRRAALVVVILLACLSWTLVRTAGVRGDTFLDVHWRWTPTPEERLLARADDEPKPLPPSTSPAQTPQPGPAATIDQKPLDSARGGPSTVTAPAAAPATEAAKVDATKVEAAGAEPVASAHADARAEWPGFRGPVRDGVVRGAHIATDWSRTPPVQMWRRPIGPGWSSFAVRGDLLYTQEQRGDDEIVACYRVSTGEPVWRHRDPVRFYESNGGPGPRGTPAIHNDRVYSIGATGILNALDADTGKVAWSRNAATDTGVELPGWGFTSSPLVVDEVVIVAMSGQLAAYDIGTGSPRWTGPKGGAGYSSPHLVTIDGVPQVMLLRGSRTISVAPADGTLLWEHVWQPGVSIVQPAMTPDGDVLITVGDAMGGLGMRRLSVKRGAAGWNVEERWTSRGLKPYFNDFVVHEGQVFGFDGTILAAIDLATGERKWKGGRYGHGQMILLPDQDLLLVLSEDGELAIVAAAPDKFTEIARVPAIDGKTWNHPVLVGNVLLVRNGEEMAAYRVPRLSSSATDR